MRNLLISSLLACLVVGCAFQKDQADEKYVPTRSVESPAQSIFQAVKYASFEEVQSLIESRPMPDLATIEENGQTLLEVALQRGNHTIVSLLIAKGASAFIKGSSFHKKPYLLVRDYSPDSGGAIGAWAMLQYQNLSTYGTLEKAWAHFQKINLGCSDLLNIHSFMSVFSNTFSNTVLGLAETYCQDNLDNQNLKIWLLGEIISLSRHPDGNLNYLKYLLSRKKIDTMEIELPVAGGKLVGTPFAFIKLALSSKDLAPQHAQLTTAAELLPQTRSYITFKASEDIPLISRTFFDLDHMTEQEAEDLKSKYVMATGMMGVKNMPLCLMGCHITPYLMDEN
ncbi:ankyrin repeat domain-containing protein [Bdellovibrio bacteriovorus]|uniref:Uncharacterized protein n=1 Tax=Bdellovibrio bacteriovorus TaxID=959 RepID=A0A1Z3N4Z6_BDEBC|nr:ankyrin repeat domain-containing protein [Bdellovibrio bacteriovorus]ASD62553.1 hypothetical protein B9G79_02695 [Bdellovibrio bacteriovorus]